MGGRGNIKIQNPKFKERSNYNPQTGDWPRKWDVEYE
jgi:hypothetical protein